MEGMVSVFSRLNDRFRRFGRTVAAGVIALFLLNSALAPREAQALDKHVKLMLTTSLYGLAGGAIIGMAMFPFTGKSRHIFIGSSVGLWSGIAMGGYILVNRLQGGGGFLKPRSSYQAPSSYEGGGDYEDDAGYDSYDGGYDSGPSGGDYDFSPGWGPEGRIQDAGKPVAFYLAYPVLRF